MPIFVIHFNPSTATKTNSWRSLGATIVFPIKTIIGKEAIYKPPIIPKTRIKFFTRRRDWK